MKYSLFIVMALALLAPPSAPPAMGACSDAVHAKYTTTGPDGAVYPTWHPHFDTQNGCYFLHEHGSNPELFRQGYKPAYGYSAQSMPEAHQGFKNVAWDDELGRRWLLTLHIGTAGRGRLCQAHHTFDIAVVDVATNALLADTHMMGDFGAAVANATGQPLTPPECPTQATANASRGIRRFRVETSTPTNYEPWRVDLRGLALDFDFYAALSVNTLNTMTSCDTLTCTQLLEVGPLNRGNFREIVFDNNFGLVPRSGANSGTFYTDPHGAAVVPAGTPGALKQYVAPDVNLLLPGRHCDPLDNHSMFYSCHVTGPISTTPYQKDAWIEMPN